MKSIKVYRTNFRKTVIPTWYSSKIQKIFIALVFILSMIGIFYLSYHNLFSIKWFFFAFFYHHTFIYFFHRYALHNRVKLFNWAFVMHVQHHAFYINSDMTPPQPNDAYMLLMPYHAVLGYLAYALIFPILIYFIFSFHLEFIWANLTAIGIYYGVYEFIHYISHLPKESKWMKITPLNFMRKFHTAHHDPKLKDLKHFDIAFPLYDFIFKSRIKNPDL